MDWIFVQQTDSRNSCSNRTLTLMSTTFLLMVTGSPMVPRSPADGRFTWQPSRTSPKYVRFRSPVGPSLCGGEMGRNCSICTRTDG